MKKTELYALSALLLAILLASFKTNISAYILYLAHLSYITVILFMLFKNFDFQSLLSLFYKMFLSSAVVFQIQGLPLVSELYITGICFVILSIGIILLKNVEKKPLLLPFLFLNISSFLIYVYN